MADYFMQTVVHQTIPHADITPLERLLLSHIFEVQPDGDGLYPFSEQGPSDMLWLTSAELEEALAASMTAESAANGFIREQLAKSKADEGEIELDMSEPGWPFLFQDIVRRSSTLKFVSIEAAFTCSKMRSDGFGGMAMLITGNDVFSKSTGELLQEFEDQSIGHPGSAGDHILCRLRYSAIRAIIAERLDEDDIAPEAVTNLDIADAIRAAIERKSFETMQMELEGHRAARAITRARKRLRALPNDDKAP
jgi:hypothetical protein